VRSTWEKKAQAKTAAAPTAAENAAGLLQAARAENPRERADALARLAADASVDAQVLQGVLEQGMADADPEVRAQAVSGLARQGGVDMLPLLQTALRDPDASVRLMAVGTMRAQAQDLALLREALADPDESVSALAAMKLELAVRPNQAR
jgi:HEAT repeat protein